MISRSMAYASYERSARHYIDALPNAQGEWLTKQRHAALGRFAEMGFPSQRQEAWRYTGIEGLLKQGFIMGSDADTATLPRETVREFSLDSPAAGRLVFVDGLFQPSLSDATMAGVKIGSLRDVMAMGEMSILQTVGSLSGLGDSGFSTLNLATFADGAMIRVEPGTHLETALEILHITTAAADGHGMRPRHLILMEEGSSAQIVERYLSLSDVPYFNNLVVEILLEKDASLTHQRLQQESMGAYHLSNIYLELGARARYQGVNAAVGAAWSRTAINVQFTAPDAKCELDGLYMAGDGQLVDFHLDVDHAVPGCESRENFKGIINGRGRAVFDGRIIVRPQAQQSSAHLSNANLMLSERAEVDTKPQLQILADDVQCSHGTSVGQLDREAVFYMRSRGLSEDQARRLLCVGFADEILERFTNEMLREQLDEQIQRRLLSPRHAIVRTPAIEE